ncbi:unnamed protein product [Lupinus luteus]|uniref:Uncharacterized protein n=1 Tax=Lupinus luteus TaxID=3873 RepID=A0AAV1XX93_LUPLU
MGAPEVALGMNISSRKDNNMKVSPLKPRSGCNTSFYIRARVIPIRIEPNGTNIPQGGNNDGAYWIDLSRDAENKYRVSKGDLKSAKSYVHVKAMYGGTFTDLALWAFYPLNGPSRVKVKFIKNIDLGKIGEHVGEWEHVTLRISNFNGPLW